MDQDVHLSKDISTFIASLNSLSKRLEERYEYITSREASLLLLQENTNARFEQMKKWEDDLNQRETKYKKENEKLIKEQEQWKQIEKVKELNLESAPDQVTFYVGKQFIVPKKVFSQHADSYFTNLLNMEPNVKPGVYFIDRNPKYASMVLDYITQDKINPVKQKQVTLVTEEFEFFNVPSPLLPTEAQAPPPTEAQPPLPSVSLPPLPVPPVQLGSAMFDSSGLLANHQEQIQAWLPDKHLVLTYKATQDGFSSQDYHRLCDGGGPSLTVIQSRDGYIFGGFIQQCIRNNLPVLHSRSFLFALINPYNLKPTQYPLNSASSWPVPKLDPQKHVCLGWGKWTTYDIELSGNSNLGENSYSSFPYAFMDVTGKGKHTFTGSGYFQTKEVEVYSVIPVRSAKLEKSFLGGRLLSPSMQETIQLWFPIRHHFSLLHKATHDGFDFLDFRSCIGKERTLTILQSVDGSIFGGYSFHPFSLFHSTRLVPFISPPSCHPANFIFSLSNPHNSPPIKFSPVPSPPQKKVTQDPGHYFPVGGGVDILVSLSGVCEAYFTNFPFSFVDSSGKGEEAFTGAASCTICEIEVYYLVN